MSPRTPTRPPTDRSMWRRLVARAHPDAGGAHDLFIWTGAVRDMVCSSSLRTYETSDRSDTPPYKHHEETSRVSFDEDADLDVLTARALAMAEAVAEPYAYLLRQVADCYPASEGPLYDQGRRGASYKTLAAIGHRVGMTKIERVQWYRIAETVPLSQRHAGHILSKLKRDAAA